MTKNPYIKLMATTLACGAALPSISSAATYVRNTATGSWATISEWSDNGGGAFAVSTILPGITDTAVVNQGRLVQVNSVIGTAAGTVLIANQNSGAATSFMEVNAGSLTTGSFTVSASTDAGDLKVQGGALTTDSFSVNGNGTVAVTSGSLSSAALNQGGTMNVSGTGAVTSTGAYTNTGTTNVSGGTLATGTSQISVTGGSFNVNGGAVTATGGASTSAAGALKADGGNINLSSGSITINENSAGGSTTHVTSTGSGELNVSGGSFIVQGQTAASDTVQFNGEVTISGTGTVFSVAAGQVITNSTAVFNIEGDGISSIVMNNLNLVSSRTATFNFTFDDDGVETVTNSGFMGLSSAILNVDGSAYAGGIASFDLFTSANLTSTIDGGNIAVTGLGVEGVDWEIVQDFASDDNVTLNILTIPEPNAYALLGGLLALSFVMVRRRRS